MNEEYYAVVYKPTGDYAEVMDKFSSIDEALIAFDKKINTLVERVELYHYKIRIQPLYVKVEWLKRWEK